MTLAFLLMQSTHPLFYCLLQEEIPPSLSPCSVFLWIQESCSCPYGNVWPACTGMSDRVRRYAMAQHLCSGMWPSQRISPISKAMASWYKSPPLICHETSTLTLNLSIIAVAAPLGIAIAAPLKFRDKYKKRKSLDWSESDVRTARKSLPLHNRSS